MAKGRRVKLGSTQQQLIIGIIIALLIMLMTCQTPTPKAIDPPGNDTLPDPDDLPPDPAPGPLYTCDIGSEVGICNGGTCPENYNCEIYQHLAVIDCLCIDDQGFPHPDFDPAPDDEEPDPEPDGPITPCEDVTVNPDAGDKDQYCYDRGVCGSGTCQAYVDEEVDEWKCGCSTTAGCDATCTRYSTGLCGCLSPTTEGSIDVGFGYFYCDHHAHPCSAIIP